MNRSERQRKGAERSPTMRFPQSHKLYLNCIFERIVAGKLHSDGRRYLPLIVLRPTGIAHRTETTQVTPPNLLLGVVDRHHVIDQGLVGQPGVARLVCALSVLSLQTPPHRQGLVPEPDAIAGYASTNPRVLGRVQEIITWEAERAHLPYESLYTEFLLDIGGGVVGVRTSMTADDLSGVLGKDRIETGDWIELARSRIDILAFDPME